MGSCVHAHQQVAVVPVDCRGYFAAEGGKGLVLKRYVDYVSPSSYGSTDRDRGVLEVYRAYITRLSPAGGVEDRLVEHDPATIVDFDDLGFAGP